MKRILLGLLALLLVSASQAGLIMHGSRLYTAAAGASELNPLADKYTLEITYPLAAGAAPTGLDADNRAYFASTEFTYEIPLASVGGMAPFTWSVSNAASGMSVVEYAMASGQTGAKLQWLSPSATASNVQLTVTDVHGHTDSVTITVTVDDTRFKWLATTGNDTTGTGTSSAPWATIAKIDTATTDANIVVIRGGTYTMDAPANENIGDTNGEARVNWSGSQQWIAYPGETPIIDFEYTGTPPYGDAEDKPRIRLEGSANMYHDGLTIRRPMVMAFHIATSGRRGNQAWRMTMEQIGPGVEGGNSSYYTWTRSPDAPRTSVVIASSEWSVTVANGAMKFYDSLKSVVDGNLFTASASEELVALKGGVEQYWVCRNKFVDQTGYAIGGNYAHNDTVPPEATYGEQCFNLVLASGAGGVYAGDGHWDTEDGGQQDIFRNTFSGVVLAQQVNSDDGPVNYERNIVINSSTPKITKTDVTEPANVVETDNLEGVSADSIIDANGSLQGAYRTSYYGTTSPRGWEIAQ